MSPTNRSGVMKVIALILALLMVSTVLVTFIFALISDM